LKCRNLNPKQTLLFFIILIGILRIIITVDRGILALNSPHDEFWYVESAYSQIWFGSSYSQMTFIHLPIYSIWLYFLYLIHVPARLGIDLAWLVAIGYLAFSILGLIKRVWLAVLLFLFLAFHPYTLIIFDRALAETFLAVTCAATLGAAINLWVYRDAIKLGLYGSLNLAVYCVCVSLAYHTREEGVILIFPLLILFAWSMAKRKYWWKGDGFKSACIPLLIAPVISIFILGLILAGANYFASGVFARNELSTSGYQRAIKALNEIDVGPTPERFSITMKMLSEAYQVSPTLDELRSPMENGVGRMWVNISTQNTGRPLEIGNGWFYWALRDVAAEAGWYKNAIFADSKFGSMADEIEDAFKKGSLRKRKLSAPIFIDPDINKWLHNLPRSMINISELVVLPNSRDLQLPSESASLEQINKYRAIAGQNLIAKNRKKIIGIGGWVKLPIGAVIGLGKNGTPIRWLKLEENERADVPGARGFSFIVEENESPDQIILQTNDGLIGTLAFDLIKEGLIVSSSGPFKADFGFDSVNFKKINLADKWITKICFAYQITGCIILISTLFGFFVIFKKGLKNSMSGIFLLLSLGILVRIFLFGLIDASSFNAIQARYLLPSIPPFACLGALSISLIKGFFQQWHA
jgi:hypothetical protein